MESVLIEGNKMVAFGYMQGVWQGSRRVQISLEHRFWSLFMENSKVKSGKVKLRQVK